MDAKSVLTQCLRNPRFHITSLLNFVVKPSRMPCRVNDRAPRGTMTRFYQLALLHSLQILQGSVQRKG